MKPLENVSRETQERLELYHALLVKWQSRINLISPSTVASAWERHFLDSAQIADLIPKTAKTLYDLGSGGGFPGLVLAILKPDLEVHLIESDAKKCAFLQTVSRETGVKVVIHNQRIEGAVQEIKTAPDVVSARALAPLSELLDYCSVWLAAQKNLTMIFPKGAQSAQEIAVSREKWDFDLVETPSLTDPKALILTLQNVQNKL